MAYIYGVSRPDARKQAAADLRVQLGMISRTVEGLAPGERQKYMSAFVDGLLEVAGSPARKSSGRRPARKDRVAKRRKKSRVTCLGCGAGMKGKDAACRKCGRPSPVAEVRAAMKAAGVVFIGKSQRPVCPRCRQSSRPGARHCTSCGSGLLSVVKSAAQIDHERYMAMARREADPGRREVYFKAANPDIYGGKNGRAS